MHRSKTAADILKVLHLSKTDRTQESSLVSMVCSYFDSVKREDLKQADLNFLKFLATSSGIPQFFSMLENFGNNTSIKNLNLGFLNYLLYDKNMEVSEGSVLHKYQKEVYDKFKPGKLNRYFLSASTSFGKTYIIFDIIRKMKYKNIVLIFPTIALLSENFERIHTDLDDIKQEYSIHTLSDVKEPGEKNIFIFTPERFLSYVEKDTNLVKDFDFVFIDEIYKLDNEYGPDSKESKENERDIAYRLASFYALDKNIDALLAGPYVNLPNDKKSSFNIFLSHNNIVPLNYNDIEIVNKTKFLAYNKLKVDSDHLTFCMPSGGKLATLEKRLILITQEILNSDENSIIYCSYPSNAEKYANLLSESIEDIEIDDDLSDFISHIEDVFGKDWLVVKALKKGIGIHHGLIPKYMQKEIISLFNSGKIKLLFSTTTITEGVNTSAKNLIVLQGTKGTKPLKKFDAKNIIGRAGRFSTHYSGRVFILNREFENALSKEDEFIEHKNYDDSKNKTDIDLLYVDDVFLTKEDMVSKDVLLLEIKNSNLPKELFEKYTMVKPKAKIFLYNKIIKILDDPDSCEKLNDLILNAVRGYIDYNGFDYLMTELLPIIENKDLQHCINWKGTEEKPLAHSLLVYLVGGYLKDGFIGMLNYNRKRKGQGFDINKEIMNTSKFVYNTMKYHLVKYLGVFNLLYKYHISIIKKVPESDIAGLDKILSKMEYSALSDKAKIVSDYGATVNIINYFEGDTTDEKRNEIRILFDEYEKKLFDKISKFIS